MKTSTNSPRYNRCDSCGRNAHKLAFRVKASGAHLRTATKVIGVCPSCFADDLKPKPWNKSGEPFYPYKNAELIYDHRGAHARKVAPVPDYCMPGYVPPVETVAEAVERAAANPKRATVTLNGRAVWKWCLHPAELDVNEHCLTCGADLS